MAYRFERGQSIEREVPRIADKQLELAIAGLRSIDGRKRDAAIREARRHVKKVRALMRLTHPVKGRGDRAVQGRLRAVNRLLGPIADGEAVVETLDRFGEKYREELPRRLLMSMHTALVRRWARANRRAKADHVLRRALGLLRAERRRVQTWRLDAGGFRAVSVGLTKSVRGARRAMNRAMHYPSIDHYHRWRRRVKDHWFHVRLLDGRCGDAFVAMQQHLEGLDGCLGEYHDCALLQQALVSDASLSREVTTPSLRLLRKYEVELRHEAQDLGAQIYSETPRQFVARVKRAWRSPQGAAAGTETRASWPRAA